MNEEIQEKINNLSMLEQNMQQLSAQRQSFQNQMLEIDSALEEITGSNETYKIIGTIMIKTEPLKLKADLESKKKLIEIRIKSIEKQEDAIKDKSKKLQEEIMSSLESSKEEPKKPSNKKARKEEEQ
ncbi:MAG: prefoldin subunit [Candidatus Nanoarchaeia archaeon]